MKKLAVIYLILVILIMGLSSCAPLRKPLDDRTNYSKYLFDTEIFIRQEDWTNALNSMEKSQKAWNKLKPLLQVDIDHDYVNDIDNNFTLLKGYIETEEKSDSLATILLLQKIWDNIGEM
ncbi:MAG: DUF4363 family protein [Desulfotomaculaceae bacterium]|nr:DUF4363 family protein [Desulfotomaculaceae bacterium]